MTSNKECRDRWSKPKKGQTFFHHPWFRHLTRSALWDSYCASLNKSSRLRNQKYEHHKRNRNIPEAIHKVGFHSFMRWNADFQKSNVPQKCESIRVLNSPVRMYLIQVIQRLESVLEFSPDVIFCDITEIRFDYLQSSLFCSEPTMTENHDSMWKLCHSSLHTNGNYAGRICGQECLFDQK